MKKTFSSLAVLLTSLVVVVGLGAAPAWAAKEYVDPMYCLTGVGNTRAEANLVTNHVKQTFATSANQVRTYWNPLLPVLNSTRWTNNSNAVNAYVNNPPGGVIWNARWFCG